jgi:ABC-type multidrug transport system fused ATPase/permease subunit
MTLTSQTSQKWWLLQMAMWQISWKYPLYILSIVGRCLAAVGKVLQLQASADVLDSIAVFDQQGFIRSVVVLTAYTGGGVVLSVATAHVSELWWGYAWLQTQLCCSSVFLTQRHVEVDPSRNSGSEFNQLYENGTGLVWLASSAGPALIEVMVILGATWYMTTVVTFSPLMWVMGIVPHLLVCVITSMESRFQRVIGKRVSIASATTRTMVMDILACRTHLRANGGLLFGEHKILICAADEWSNRLNLVEHTTLTALSSQLVRTSQDIALLIVGGLAVMDGQLSIGWLPVMVRFMGLFHACITALLGLYIGWGRVLGTTSVLYTWMEESPATPQLVPPYPLHSAMLDRHRQRMFGCGTPCGLPIRPGRPLDSEETVHRTTGQLAGYTTGSPGTKGGAESDEATNLCTHPQQTPVSVEITGLTVEGLFQHAQLSMDAGELVLLCGDNGTGKSTLVSVVAGVKQPLNGARVLVGPVDQIDGWSTYDGHRSVYKGHWPSTRVPMSQHRIAVVFQPSGTHQTLVPGTLRDNVLLGTTSWTDQSRNRTTYLPARDGDNAYTLSSSSSSTSTSTSPSTWSDHALNQFIIDSHFPWNWESWPNGWNTVIVPGQHGRYSGGEMQRIALLRVAVNSDAGLILLDEPMSALDDVMRDWFVRWLKGNGNQRRHSTRTDRHGRQSVVSVSEQALHYRGITALVICHQPQDYLARGVCARTLEIRDQRVMEIHGDAHGHQSPEHHGQ